MTQFKLNRFCRWIYAWGLCLLLSACSVTSSSLNPEYAATKSSKPKIDAKMGPFDNDGDGVIDRNDACPYTKKDLSVDHKGCVDSDNDGSEAFSDQCPDTPRGVKAGYYGCQIKE